MAKTVKLDIDKIVKSYETVESIENCVSAHNFHEYFFDMEDYIDEVNLKHDKCFSGYQDRIYEIIESIDKIKNKINLLSDSLRKTVDKNSRLTDLSKEQAAKVNRQANLDVQYRDTLSPVNNDSSKEIIPVPTPTIEEQKQEGLFPEGYDTTPIGLGIGAAGITGAIGAVVIDSMMPKSAKKQQPKYEIDDDDINDYRDYEIADEAEEKPIVSLKIDPSMTSYQASRNHESMKKFYNDEEER
jgi:hypothetical protein